MRRPFQAILMLLGTAWAQALLVLGMALLWMPSGQPGRVIPAVAILGAGALVAMWLVIDPLVPSAGRAVVLPLKTVALTAFLFGIAAAVA